MSRSFQAKSDAELLRALFVYRACTIRPIVRHAERLLHLSNRLLGVGLTRALLKRTFFGQFVAGETAEEVVPVVDRLEKSGLGAILDYAAEADVSGEHGGTGHAVSARSAAEDAERQHDANTALFASSIEAAGQRKDGLAAIKLTAMGSPDLLIQVTDFVVAVKRLFHAMATGAKVDDHDIPQLHASAAITRAQFRAGLAANGMTMAEQEADVLFDAIAATSAPPLLSSPSASSSFPPSASSPSPPSPAVDFLSELHSVLQLLLPAHLAQPAHSSRVVSFGPVRLRRARPAC